MAVLPRSIKKLVQMPDEPVRRWTVSEYHQMIKAGILDEDDPFELLEGWLVPKAPHNPPRDLAIALTEREIENRLPPDWVRRSQSGLTTSDSEPEPAIAIVRGPQRRYKEEHPGPVDTAMVIEVADSTLERDRTFKLRIFARAKIPVYWIINLPDMKIEVYTEPVRGRGKPRYLKRQDYGSTDSVPLVIEGKEIGQFPVRDLLP